MSLTKIVRNAIIDNATKGEMFDQIAEEACCERAVAKQLLFSFLWFPEEEHLEKVLQGVAGEYKTSRLVG